MVATAEATPANGEEQKNGEPEKRPERVDVVQMVERHIDRLITRAESEEETVEAKIISQRSKVARLSIAILRIDQAKKQVSDRLKEEVGILDLMEADAQRESDRRNAPAPLFDDPALRQPAKPEEAWRTLTLADLRITGKIAEALTEAGLTTRGAIADWTAGGKLLTDIKGVGEKAGEKIENAFMAWDEANVRTSDEILGTAGEAAVMDAARELVNGAAANGVQIEVEGAGPICEMAAAAVNATIGEQASPAPDLATLPAFRAAVNRVADERGMGRVTAQALADKWLKTRGGAKESAYRLIPSATVREWLAAFGRGLVGMDSGRIVDPAKAAG